MSKWGHAQSAGASIQEKGVRARKTNLKFWREDEEPSDEAEHNETLSRLRHQLHRALYQASKVRARACACDEPMVGCSGGALFC